MLSKSAAQFTRFSSRERVFINSGDGAEEKLGWAANIFGSFYRYVRFLTLLVLRKALKSGWVKYF